MSEHSRYMFGKSKEMSEQTGKNVRTKKGIVRTIQGDVWKKMEHVGTKQENGRIKKGNE